MQKYIAIGDIHGCGKTLEKLLNRLRKHDDRIFVFMGDYIDRGPNSKLAIDLSMKLGETHECIYLRGNHEEMLLDAFESRYAGHWTRNGGLQTMISLGIKNVNGEIPEPYGQFIMDTIYYYDTDDYFFVHGGIPPMASIEQILGDGHIEPMLWERSHIDARSVEWEKPVVFGHTPLHKPMLEEKKIGIDTGCVFYNDHKLGMLSAVLLPERKVIQEKYCEF